MSALFQGRSGAMTAPISKLAETMILTPVWNGHPRKAVLAPLPADTGDAAATRGQAGAALEAFAIMIVITITTAVVI